MRWLTSLPWPPADGAATAFVDTAFKSDPLEQEAIFAVTLGGVLIGVTTIQAPGDLAVHADCPTLGYWIGRPFQGFGYASEAATAALEWAFATHRCEGVAARVFADNDASRKLLLRLGFRETERMMRRSRALGREVENVLLRLKRGERQRREAAQ